MPAAKERIQWLIAGHDHRNNYYTNIAGDFNLGFGMKTGTGAYPTHSSMREGARFFEIDSLDNMKVRTWYTTYRAGENENDA